MYLGLDYRFALGRQAELMRWAEDQRKLKLLRSNQHLEVSAYTEAPLNLADQDVAEPIAERRAS